MKRVKIMLASMAIVAIIGSGLAAKAERFGVAIFTGTSPDTCTNLTLNSTFVPSLAGNLYATTISGSKTNCVRVSLALAQ